MIDWVSLLYKLNLCGLAPGKGPLGRKVRATFSRCRIFRELATLVPLFHLSVSLRILEVHWD